MKKLITYLVLVLGLVACGGGGGGGASSGGGSTNPPPDLPPPPDTANLTFGYSDFSEVAVRNSFQIIVQEGREYSISITVDQEYAHLVDVIKEGVRLRIGFREDFTGDIRATTLEGIVTLPQLTAIELLNSATVTMAGFSESFLEVGLSDSSILEGPNNRIDLVSGTLGGSSQLKLQDISPLPAAHIELSGSSMTARWAAFSARSSWVPSSRGLKPKISSSR